MQRALALWLGHACRAGRVLTGDGGQHISQQERPADGRPGASDAFRTRLASLRTTGISGDEARQPWLRRLDAGDHRSHSAPDNHSPCSVSRSLSATRCPAVRTKKLTASPALTKASANLSVECETRLSPCEASRTSRALGSPTDAAIGPVNGLVWDRGTHGIGGRLHG